MIEKDWDIIVAGGGIAGLTATSVFSRSGFKVLCIEPQKAPVRKTAKSADLRSTAYLQNAVALFKKAGVWSDLVNHAESLKVLRIFDAGKSDTNIQQSNFNSKEIGLSQFGFNIPNWLTKKVLISAIRSSAKAKIVHGTKIVGLTSYLRQSVVKLDDGTELSTRLVVAADGKNSDIRFLSNIQIKKWDDGQDGIAFTVLHQKPHNNTSIEILKSGGPCTLVPLKSTSNGDFQSAVVWVEQRAKAKALIKLNEKDFSRKLSYRTEHVLGECTLNSKRSAYPIITQLAEKFYSDRVALIAEAAHVMPPIGAQGLNTSFDDIAKLNILIKEALIQKADPGALNLLTEYGTSRRKEAVSKMLGITFLNKVSQSNLEITKSFRNLGLRIIEGNSLIKKTLMRTGLGIPKLK